MPFTIIRNDLAKMHVDVIVNSTRRRPIMGYATDRYLHEIAGPKMMDERKRYGVLETSQAIITKGYGLPSDYVIHTVGPTYSDGKQGEAQALFNTYMNVLELARKQSVRTIAFPLISSGTFCFPKEQAFEIAISAFKIFLQTSEMDIYLVVYDDISYAISKARIHDVKEYLGHHYYPGKDPFKTPQKAKKRTLEDMVDSVDVSFQEKLFKLIRDKRLDEVMVYKDANLTKQHFSKIRSSDTYKPKKDTILALCVAMRLSLDETEDLLASAGFVLSSSDKADMIVRFFIESKVYDIYEINLALYDYCNKWLGGSEKSLSS
ncbi:MAG: macro domain-containing protein [Acholeplasmataceae bacterium]|nr:macro domain-containing protein [Acholeplasmataceae bacterium]